MLKMRNIVTRARIQPISLAFRASVLPLYHVGSLMSPLYLHPPVYVVSASEVSAAYYTHSAGIVGLLMLTITHIQGRFNNHTVHSLYRIMVTVTSVVDVMKMGNTVPRVGCTPTYISGIPGPCATITARVLSWHHHYSHPHLSRQLLDSEVSADYYTRPAGIVSLLILTIR